MEQDRIDKFPASLQSVATSIQGGIAQHGIQQQTLVSVRKIALREGIVLLVLILCVFVTDCCVSVATILKFNKRLAAINEISKKIHVISDQIGENIYENVTDALEKKEKFEEDHEDLLNEIEDKKLILNENVDELKGQIENLNQEYKRLLEEKKYGFERLLKAFPDMKSRENNEILAVWLLSSWRSDRMSILKEKI